MGLDMYLTGTKRPARYFRDELKTVREDGFPVETINIELGYWRKHPDLHGYIVKEFANGEDNCEPIWLDREKLVQILEAVKEDNFETTSGFFFGESRAEDRQPSIDMLTKAIEWLDACPEAPDVDEPVMRESRSVEYQASW